MPGPFHFFARGEDLDPGAHWRVTGDHDRPDVGARDLATRGMTESVPIYAVRSGEVMAAWRNAPENPPDDVHEGRKTTPPTIARSGNFLVVRSNDGHTVLYAHLLNGTIPRTLCPNDDQFMTDADDKEDGLPRESIIPDGQRPRVAEGQYLGLMGNSGASSGRHLHIHLKPPQDSVTDSSSIHIRYKRAWVHRNPGSDPTNSARRAEWMQLRDDHLERGDAIWPSALLRWDVAIGQPATRIALGVMGSTVLTAVRGTDGRLQTQVHRLTTGGFKDILVSAKSGPVDEVAVVSAASVFALGVRGADGRLAIRTLRIRPGPDGSEAVYVIDTDTLGAASQIVLERCTQSDFSGIVAAMRDGDGHLRLRSWEIDDQGKLSRRGLLALDTRVTAVSVTSLFSGEFFDGLVVAVRDGNGRLQVLTFDISDGGRDISLRDRVVEGEVADVAIESLSPGRDACIVALRDSDGNLRVIRYDIDGNGSIQRRGHSIGGSVREIAVSRAHGLDWGAVVAMRDGQENLRIIPFEAMGDRMLRLGGVTAGQASHIAIDRSQITIDGRDFVIAGLIDADSKARLISFCTNFW